MSSCSKPRAARLPIAAPTLAEAAPGLAPAVADKVAAELLRPTLMTVTCGALQNRLQWGETAVGGLRSFGLAGVLLQAAHSPLRPALQSWRWRGNPCRAARSCRCCCCRALAVSLQHCRHVWKGRALGEECIVLVTLVCKSHFTMRAAEAHVDNVAIQLIYICTLHIRSPKTLLRRHDQQSM